MQSTHYNDNVFINCPFDAIYKPLFDAMIFAVHDCGLFRVVHLRKTMPAKFELIKFIISSG